MHPHTDFFDVVAQGLALNEPLTTRANLAGLDVSVDVRWLNASKVMTVSLLGSEGDTLAVRDFPLDSRKALLMAVSDWINELIVKPSAMAVN